EFRDLLQRPLLKKLESRKLFTFGPSIRSEFGKGRTRKLVSAKIRYAVLCYGVPVKILKDPTLVEEEADRMRPELRRNEAAVDSELAWLPLGEQHITLAGPMTNPLYGTTNADGILPVNGVLMVTRLDGPTAA